MGEISEYGQDNPLLPLIDAYKGTRDWKDAFSQALRRVGQNVGIVPTPEKQRTWDEAQSVMPEMSSPAQRQIVQDLAMGFGTDAGPGMIGALRKGGRPDLYATHRLNQSLHQPAPSQLTNPSWSLTKLTGGADDARVPFHESGQYPFVVPRVGALELHNSPGQIFNRDAYTSQASEGTAYKWGTDSLRGEGPNHYDRRTQAAAIQMSPEFNSIKHYETSPHGAGVLDKYDPEAGNWNWGTLNSEYQHQLAKRPDSRENILGMDLPPETPEFLRYLRKAAKEGDEEARHLLTALRSSPSEYGELKTRGNFALTSDRLAGVVTPESAWNNTPRGAANMFEHQLGDRGITHLVAPEHELQRYIQQLADWATPYGGK